MLAETRILEGADCARSLSKLVPVLEFSSNEIDHQSLAIHGMVLRAPKNRGLVVATQNKMNRLSQPQRKSVWFIGLANTPLDSSSPLIDIKSEKSAAAFKFSQLSPRGSTPGGTLFLPNCKGFRSEIITDFPISIIGNWNGSPIYGDSIETLLEQTFERTSLYTEMFHTERDASESREVLLLVERVAKRFPFLKARVTTRTWYQGRLLRDGNSIEDASGVPHRFSEDLEKLVKAHIEFLKLPGIP